MRQCLCRFVGVAVLTAAAWRGGDSQGSQPPKGEVPAEVKAVLDLTNAERAKQKLAPLKLNVRLNKAAKDHSVNMARQEKLEHDLDGKGPGERVRATGYKPLNWGENIAVGRSAERAMEMWMNSKGHRENILKAQFTELGVGIAQDEQGRKYYTQVFGRQGK